MHTLPIIWNVVMAALFFLCSLKAPVVKMDGIEFDYNYDTCGEEGALIKGVNFKLSMQVTMTQLCNLVGASLLPNPYLA